jgi:murein DD-endopeptidase MepM/ murein hydrolase activator NlpD
MWIALAFACAADETGEDSAVPDTIARGALSFRFPLVEVERFTLTVGVDHDPEDHSDGPVTEQVICTTYDGRTFPYCYDEHHGSDYILDGGFEAMDAGSATIVAAAPGRVVELDDGHYDRCHKTTQGIDCDGNDGQPNYVILEHEGGWRTRYWHMLSGSVVVEVGQAVACGDTLGQVGSSGYSSQPHLHFELDDPDGERVDPYAGEFSQPETWWEEQGPPGGLPGATCAEAAG